MRGLVLLASLFCASAIAQQGLPLGLFSRSGDIGSPVVPGSVEFSNGQYKITGSGANIWGKHDQFQYVWKELTGDFSVTGTMQFVGAGVEHRKAGIMVRQSSDADAAFADVVVHGSGMPAIQWRSRQSDDVNTFDLPPEGTGNGRYTLKLVRTGVKIYLYLAQNGDEPKKVLNTEVSFRDPVLVGLIVCAHQPNGTATVVFSDVSIAAQAKASPNVQEQKPSQR